MSIWCDTSANACTAKPSPDPARATRALTAAAVAIAAWAGPAAAQTDDIDAGRLELREGGQRVGVENFRVWRSGSTLNAIATVESGGREAQVGLRIGVDHRPIRFERIADGRRTVEADWGGDRVRIHTLSEDGERWKELPSRGPGSVLEPGVGHHYLVLVHVLRESGGGRAGVIVPSRGESADARMGGESADQVTIGGRAVAATRYELRIGGSTVNVWVDAEGRLLRVHDPSTGREAIRLPR